MILFSAFQKECGFIRCCSASCSVHCAAFAFYLHQRVAYAVIRSEKMHIVLSGKYGRHFMHRQAHTHTGACERSGKAHVTLLLQFRLTNGNWSGNIFCPHCMAAVPTEQIDQMRWANSAKWIGTCAALASMSMCGLLPFESNYSHVLFAQKELYFFVQGTGLDRQQSITIHDAMIIRSRVHLVFVCHNFSLLLLLSKSISVGVAIAIHPGHINSMLQLRSAHRTLHILRSPPNNKPFWLFDITIVHKCRLNWIVIDRKTLCAEISIVELSAPANERNNKKEKSDNKQFRQKEICRFCVHSMPVSAQNTTFYDVLLLCGSACERIQPLAPWCSVWNGVVRQTQTRVHTAHEFHFSILLLLPLPMRLLLISFSTIRSPSQRRVCVCAIVGDTCISSVP